MYDSASDMCRLYLAAEQKPRDSAVESEWTTVSGDEMSSLMVEGNQASGAPLTPVLAAVDGLEDEIPYLSIGVEIVDADTPPEYGLVPFLEASFIVDELSFDVQEDAAVVSEEELDGMIEPDTPVLFGLDDGEIPFFAL